MGASGECKVEWAKNVRVGYLDVDAKAELRRALQEYKGGILMACHEAEFYRDLASDVWDCAQWTTRVI